MSWFLARRSLTMAFREVDVIEVREVLRGWLDGAGLRTIAGRAGVDRKTARRYVEAAQAAGLTREAGQAALCDELLGAVIAGVRPARPNGHGAAWDLLAARKDDITKWVKDGLTIVKIEVLLTRSGTTVPYRTLHRFASEECGFRARGTSMRVLDGEPGVECQIDFAQMGLITDTDTGRRRKVHALIFTAVLSRHMFVHLSYSQTLTDVIAGCEAAWAFYDGVFKVLIPDNLKPVVTDADPVNPRLSVGWLDYSQHAGFATDPARVRSPQDKDLVSYCASWGGWGGNSVAKPVSSAAGQVRVAGSGWLVEPFVLVVGLMGDEQAGVVPGLDGGGVHAELLGDFGEGEHAPRTESCRVVGEPVFLSDVDHNCCGEGFSAA